MICLNHTTILQLKELDDDGSDETLKQLIKLYLDTAPLKIQKMQAFLNENDFVNIRREAHSLRSSSMILGAEKLSHFANEAENSRENPGAELIKKIHEEFQLLKVELELYL